MPEYCRNLLWICLLACCVRGFAVDAQPIDLRIDRDVAVEDFDFAWVYWFETHGQRYVRGAVWGRALPWDTPGSRRWRGEVAQTLMPLLEDGDGGVRAAAVLSLARMGHAEVLERVMPGMLLDESEDVRLACWAAMGLLETEASRAALAAEPFEAADEVDVAGQAMAIGLLTKLERTHAKWLVARLDDPAVSLEVKRWCVWSLREHPTAEMDPIFEAALNKLPSTFVISEVLGTEGFVGRKGGSEWLVDVLRYHPDMRGWPGYRALSGVPAERLYGSSPRRLAMETRVAAALALADQPLVEDAEDRRFVLSQLKRRMVAGNVAQSMDFNRGFDTLAYFMHCEGGQAERDLLYDQLRGYTELRTDDPGVLEQLEEDEKPARRDLFIRQTRNELRGYAAIAAGLMMQRATEGTALYKERPLLVDGDVEVERLKRRFGIRLMRAVADDREPVSYRAACALALGLSGDDRYKIELAEELGKLKAGDEAVLGYGLLALAMLGEERAAGPAQRYLARPGAVSGLGDQLGRRAALRAFGVIGAGAGDETQQALVDAWGRDLWVSRHAAEAAAWVGRYEAVPTMMKALRSESANWRRTAAASLGLVFDQSFPSRLSPLIEGMNPTLSLRPTRIPNEDANFVQPADAEAKAIGRGWPMGRMHALGDPFVIEAMRGSSDAPTPDGDQDAR